MSVQVILKCASIFLKLSEELAERDHDDIVKEIQQDIEWKAFWAIKHALINFAAQIKSNLYFTFVRGNLKIASRLEEKLNEWLSDNILHNEHNKTKMISYIDKVYLNLVDALSTLQGNEAIIIEGFGEGKPDAKQDFDELLEHFQKVVEILNAHLGILLKIEKEVEARIRSATEVDFRPTEMIGEDLYAL